MTQELARTIWTELAGLDFSVSTIDAGGIPTRSLRAGNGAEHIVFLHGTSGHLEAFVQNIKPHAERYTVHAIDMPRQMPVCAAHGGLVPAKAGTLCRVSG